MKLRVKYFIHEYWVVQRQRFGIFWIAVKQTLVNERCRGLSTRWCPVLKDSFEEALAEASKPGAMEKHIADQRNLALGKNPMARRA